MSPAPPQEDKNDHLGKSATLVQKAGIVVRAGGSATWNAGLPFSSAACPKKQSSNAYCGRV